MFDAKNDSVASYATISPFEGTLNIICVAQNDAGSSHRFWSLFEFFPGCLLLHVADLSSRDPFKWNMFDYRRILCYYSKMYFNQVWRTWKPFDLDQTRNIDANWIWITLSIGNHVKNRSDHRCRTSIIVSESFLIKSFYRATWLDQTHALFLREHTKNDSVKTFYPAETLLTSSQETTLMPHTV